MATVTVVFGGEKVSEHPVGKSAVIGRGANCDIPIDNLAVSRAHCQIINRGNTFVLQDMNSASGTYVNGRRIEEHYLNDGDEILIGKHTLVFDAKRTIEPPKEETRHADMDLPERTYVMDRGQIQERLAEMRAVGSLPQDEEPAEEPGTGFNLPPPPGKPLPRPMKASEHAAGFDPLKPQSMPQTRPQARPRAHTAKYAPPSAGGGMKAFLILSLATNVVLIFLVVVLILLMTGVIRQPQLQPPRRAPAGGTPPATTPGETPE